MSTIASLDNRQLTAKRVCQHVSTSALLPQLLRQMIIDDICLRWQPSGSAQSILSKEGFVVGVASLRRQTFHERNENRGSHLFPKQCQDVCQQAN